MKITGTIWKCITFLEYQYFCRSGFMKIVLTNEEECISVELSLLLFNIVNVLSKKSMALLLQQSLHWPISFDLI